MFFSQILIILGWVNLAHGACSYSTPDCLCNGFDKFNQLDISPCENISCKNLEFEPSSGRVLFDKELLPLLEYYSRPESSIYAISLYNLAGIDLQLLRDSLYAPMHRVIWRLWYWRVVYLRFNFYLDGQPLQLSFDKNAPPGKRCNESVFVNMFGHKTNILNLNDGYNLRLLFPIFSTSNLCPFIFQHIYSSTLTIHGSTFQLDTTNYSNLNDLNSTFLTLKILYVHKLDLNNSTLHPILIGRTLTALAFSLSSFNRIQTDIFKSFRKLKLLEMTLFNPRYFFHTNGIEWMNYLNSGLDQSADYDENWYLVLHIRTNLVDNYLYQTKFFPYYEFTFSNEDYCLFQNFPHQNYLIPIIGAYYPINCSCTLYSLIKYYPYYYKFGAIEKLYYPVIWNCFNIQSWNWTGDTHCNITCNIQQTLSSYQGHYFDLYDLKNQFVFFKKWSLDVFGPVACLLGCISNSLVIFTIKSAARTAKQRTKLKDSSNYKHALVDPKQPFFVYMLINSIINLMYSVMYFFYYLIKCEIQIPGDRGFVSPVCFYETLSVNIVASILKLLSNFTFVQMSVNRYALVGQDHYKFLLKFSNMKIRDYIGWGILVSLALSIVIYFQQQFFSSSINGQQVSESYVYNDYLWYGYEVNYTLDRKIDAYNTTLTKLAQLPYLSGFSMVHDLFSYFLFCLVTTVIDAMTVVRLKRVLNEKKQLLAKTTSQVKSTKKKKPQTDEIEKSEKKSIAMIVFNSLAIFILRSPELVAVVFFYDLLLNQNSDYTFKMFCYSYRQCLAVLDLSNIFYSLSLSLTFVFYYLFNLSFKVTFIEASGLFKNFMKRSKF